ncbi:MFS general substrate transporter [Aureobasidium pullulans]|uniref:MFS general substrate transporter n=1 Tax=Aureobasidium pullulans TaxID=5580 RepID=A0A4S9ADY3_AURPU|nr:MFS general substrate transporter [Aureobasidium pullulans]
MGSPHRQHVSSLVPSNPRILTAVLLAVAVVNSATLGYDSSVMNGLLILPSYTEYFHLTDATIGLNNAAVWIGEIIATPTMQIIPDRYGRKKAILIATGITAVGIILQASAQSIAMFVVGRMIIGAGACLSNVSAPPLLGELLPPRSRSSMLGLFFSCFYVGSLLSAVINYGSQNIQSTWSWRLPSLLQLLPSVVAAIFLPFIPESPRWLIVHGEEAHAQEVLAIMNGDEDLDKAAVAAQEIRLVIANEEAAYPRNAWREILSGPANRRRLLLLVVFGAMINTLGNFIVSFYLSKILDQAGIQETYKQTQINIILSCWSFAIAILGSFMLDIMGRRLQTLVGLSGMIITLYIIGGLIKRKLTLYPTEICQYKLRTAGTAIFRLLDSGCGLMASFAMSFTMSDLGWKFYLINASWDIMFLVFVFFLFLETKGLNLEEIAVRFGDERVVEGLEVTSNEVINVVDEKVKGVDS